MENKKIYVDGVDVSECEHYRAEIETKMPYGEYETLKDKCHYSGIGIIQNCKGNKGCIYKQLQRAKAEIEKLKQESENYAIQLGVLAQALEDIREKCQITDVFGAKDIRDILDKINSVIGAE